MLRSIRNFKTRIKELDAFENKLCAYNAKMALASLFTLCAILLIQPSLQLRFGTNRSVFIIESAAAMVFAAAGTARFHYLNFKKYDLVKDLGIVTHKRAIVFDGIMHALGMMLCWCVTYLPVLLDRSLVDEKTAAIIVIPIYQPVIWMAFSLPYLFTFERILKKTGLKEKLREMKRASRALQK